MTAPTAPLLNREFRLPADGLFQFTPLGEFPIRDERTGAIVVQVVDQEAVQAMAADIAARKATPDWPGLLVDREHFSFDPEKESRAAGWANDAQARADGLFGSIRFSNTGKADVEGGDYRFLSPVFDEKAAVPLGGNRYRVTRLIGLALTNTPNIRRIRPLSNRSPGGDPAIETQATTTMNPDLLKELGLPPTATPEEVLAAVRALKAKSATAETTATEATGLRNRYTALLGTAIDRTLKEYEGTILPNAVGAWKNRLTADFDGTVELLRGLKPSAPDEAKVDSTLKEYEGVLTAESRDGWKNRLTADFDGTLALLKGIKPAAGKKEPLHKDSGAAGAQGDVGESHPFLNRAADLRRADAKLSEADALLQAAAADPKLYDAYRDSLVGEA